MLNLDEKCKKCLFCENYYGPCFDEPICITCHLFVFPNIIEQDFESSSSANLSQNGKLNPQPINFSTKFNSSNSFSNSFIFNTPSTLQDITLKFTRNFEKLDSNDSGNEDSDDQQLTNCTYATKLVTNEKPDYENTLNQAFKISCKVINKNFENSIDLDKNSNKLNIIEDVKIAPPESNTDFIDKLPNEVLLKIFLNLDDLSLWSVSQVCKRWSKLITQEIKDHQWRHFINERWIFCKPQANVESHHELYSQLVKSSNCFYCLQQIHNRPKLILGEELKKSWRHKRLLLELKSLQQDPPDGINAKPLDSSCYYWQASITGPIGSPYEGGIFYLYLKIPQSYPLNPPLVRFVTKIYHPNISRHGDIGLDSIHENWSLALTISKVLISIQSLLTDPYTHVCMERDIGELYRTNRELFEKYARVCTWKYAMNDYLIFKDNENLLKNLSFYFDSDK